MNATPMISSVDLMTAVDRCDRCGARAMVLAVLGGGELLFCNHHARKHRAGLEQVAVWIFDGADVLADAA